MTSVSLILYCSGVDSYRLMPSRFCFESFHNQQAQPLNWIVLYFFNYSKLLVIFEAKISPVRLNKVKKIMHNMCTRQNVPGDIFPLDLI